METKKIWTVTTNSDLTEGRGYPIILYCCLLKTTAVRLAHKKGVMGTNANVARVNAYYIEGKWCYPGQLTMPTEEDKAQSNLRNEHQKIINKMIEAGITEEEIKTLGLNNEN